MPMTPLLHDALEAGRDAMRRHAWEEARRILIEADSAHQLDAEGLRLLGKARDWCGDTVGSIDSFERAYAAFVGAGDRRGAAKVALMLRHQSANVLRDMGAARGWVQRAERLLVLPLFVISFWKLRQKPVTVGLALEFPLDQRALAPIVHFR